MKTTSRLSVVAPLIAALCIAPAAFAKPKHGKSKDQAAQEGFEIAPGVRQTRGDIGPGGVGIEVIRPAPLPPVGYYRRGYHPRWDHADSGVASVQRALKARGYYAGPVDGDAGPGTRAAIRGFRADHGLPPSSGIDGPLLRALRL